MEGLENRAELEIGSLVEQLLTKELVQVNHSSRDTVVLALAQAITEYSNDIVTETLVFRSGVSVAAIEQLRQALGRCPTIQHLEFCCLPSIEALVGALHCAKVPTITSLSLKSLAPWNRQHRWNRNIIAGSIASNVILPTTDDEDEDGGDGGNSNRNNSDAPANANVWVLEIVNYPLGADGARIIADAVKSNTCLKVLRLQDCDLRSDCAAHIASMIRYNHSLQILDLSYNRHYLGSPLTRELTMNTLVRNGLRYNMELLDLQIREDDDNESNGKKHLAKMNQQLAMNLLKKKYQSEHKANPFLDIPASLWPVLLSKVSTKPDILYYFVEESIAAWLPFLRA